jgi:subfamily B ATP-binding cassette protein MsbA
MAVNAIYIYICSSLTSLISNIIIVLAIVVTVSFYSLWVGLALVVVIPINYFLVRFINNRLYKKSKDLQETCGKNYQNIISLVNSPDFVKQNSSNKQLLTYIEEPLKNVFTKTAQINKFAQSSSSVLVAINILVQNLILVFLGLLFFNNNIEVSSLILISMLLPIYFASLNAFVSANVEAKDYRASFDFYNEISSKTQVDGTIPLINIESIDIKKNIIQIHNKEINIKDDYHLTKGDIIYVAGASGVGKSTFLKFFPRFRECDFITINDIPIYDYYLDTLRNNISYVSQDSTIIPRSLEDNITFTTSNTNRIKIEELYQSIILAPLLENKEPSTLILEKGVNLSGGEKQRITLARESLRNSQMIIFDESTNSIDEEYASRIYQYLIDNLKDKILIFVSHSPVVRSFCNKVIDLS